jgi:type IV secretory pathway VirB10-like protein
MSNARIFFAGMGISVLLLGVGFGSGLMLASTAMQPVTQNRATAADRLPPARVVLPASAEAASARLAPAPVETLVATGVSTPQSQERPQLAPARDVQAQSQSTERDKQAERAEKKKPEAEERDRRRRYAERKARREAARAKQQPEQQYEARRLQPNIVAFGGNEEQSRIEASSFGN